MRSPFLPIKKLQLKRFRSVEFANIELQNPLFLVGKNGAGKSNILKALEFLSECMTMPLSSVFQNQGGIEVVRHRGGTKSRPGNMGIRVDFDFSSEGRSASGMYAFEVSAKKDHEFSIVREMCRVRGDGEVHWFDRNESGFAGSVPGIKLAMDPQGLVLPLMGGATQFAPITRGLAAIQIFSLQPKAIQDLQDPDAGSRLRADGGNLASVLKSLSSDGTAITRLCELLQTIVPGTTMVRPVKHGNKLSLVFEQSWNENGNDKRKSVRHEAFSISDGTLRALGILTAFLQRNPPMFIGLEEPEATIHPEALAAILDIVRSFSRDIQVIVTTHSPELLDAKWILPENLRIVSWARGATQVLPLGESTVSTLRDHLMGAGELLRSNALTPTDLFVNYENELQMNLFDYSTVG